MLTWNLKIPPKKGKGNISTRTSNFLGQHVSFRGCTPRKKWGSMLDVFFLGIMILYRDHEILLGDWSSAILCIKNLMISNETVLERIFSILWSHAVLNIPTAIISCYLTQPMDPEKKSLNFIFPTKYVIPKSLKFSHWPSKLSLINFLLQWSQPSLKKPLNDTKMCCVFPGPSQF